MKDPTKRFSATEALEHDWFKNDDTIKMKNKFQDELSFVADNLKSFSCQTCF
jgi:hypothetical protein